MVLTKEQEDLEQPVKGYQLKEVKDELVSIHKVLEKIETQTSGIVTRKEMEDYVQKEIAEATAPLFAHKSNMVKLGWLLLTLVITDIATRLFGILK